MAKKNNNIIYMIVDKENDRFAGSYTRGNYDRYEFDSVSDARGANCHGMFKDKEKYRIAKYRVTYELIDGDVQNNKNTILKK